MPLRIGLAANPIMAFFRSRFHSCHSCLKCSDSHLLPFLLPRFQGFFFSSYFQLLSSTSAGPPAVSQRTARGNLAWKLKSGCSQPVGFSRSASDDGSWGPQCFDTPRMDKWIQFGSILGHSTLLRYESVPEHAAHGSSSFPWQGWLELTGRDALRRAEVVGVRKGYTPRRLQWWPHILDHCCWKDLVGYFRISPIDFHIWVDETARVQLNPMLTFQTQRC